ncbi:MAG TPA: DUF5683 domain-containing protein [Candidatus Kapabacteria bacterium]|nr:DUF5683 domain-containing protein [Candidatus Kapabacteria bacterium]
MNRIRTILTLLLLAALVSAPQLLAQPADSTRAASSIADSVRARAHALDTGHIHVATSDSAMRPTFRMTKNWKTALLCSLIPGGGQLYTEQYIKAPIFALGAGFFLYRALYFNGIYRDYAAQAAQYPRGSYEYESLKRLREANRDDRDLNYAFAAGVTILGAIDAYVGVHMFDFDVSDDHTSQIYLNPAGPSITFAAQW